MRFQQERFRPLLYDRDSSKAPGSEWDKQLETGTEKKLRLSFLPEEQPHKDIINMLKTVGKKRKSIIFKVPLPTLSKPSRLLAYCFLSLYAKS